ncbi:hypothetical protein RN001_000087 [Aquatica leii]|uniref:Uncharacterized protein n=1 Tax=Aquatica leii TaxID=1421715 RepID=A0AAN7SC14_9COLE|nr:hypothetical protein RN001_000087 [Aquatica leii]
MALNNYSEGDNWFHSVCLDTASFWTKRSKSLKKEQNYIKLAYIKHKNTRKMIRKNMEDAYEKMTEQVIEKNRNMKCLRRNEGKCEIIAMKNKNEKKNNKQNRSSEIN